MDLDGLARERMGTDLQLAIWKALEDRSGVEGGGALQATGRLAAVDGLPRVWIPVHLGMGMSQAGVWARRRKRV